MRSCAPHVSRDRKESRAPLLHHGRRKHDYPVSPDVGSARSNRCRPGCPQPKGCPVSYSCVSSCGGGQWWSSLSGGTKREVERSPLVYFRLGPDAAPVLLHNAKNCSQAHAG